MFHRRRQKKDSPSTPRDCRAYAVGDIHGRLDLLDKLLAAIERDFANRPARKTVLIFLGDLIDRGGSALIATTRSGRTFWLGIMRRCCCGCWPASAEFSTVG
jgi:hypothetical protein